MGAGFFMGIVFIIRERGTPNTAMHNAARLDAERLAVQGHNVAIVEVNEFELIADETAGKILDVMESLRKGGIRK